MLRQTKQLENFKEIILKYCIKFQRKVKSTTKALKHTREIQKKRRGQNGPDNSKSDQRCYAEIEDQPQMETNIK